ncbi:MAG: ParB/RepB/Spo0J family partition protein [Anaerolineae bacterium]|nr:ParB/RepB/Spo0J family partition protein [Anaerolineae bacterium]
MNANLPETEFIRVPIGRVGDNPFQIRSAYGSVSDLADSICQMVPARPETSGLIHVPLARIVLDGKILDPRDCGGVVACLEANPEARVQLAAGHRRLRAFRDLAQSDEQFAALPVTVAVLDDEAMADVAWHENEQREDTSPIERALALQRDIAAFGWTQGQAGKRRGMTQASVSNILRLLELPADIQDLLSKGVITERHGRALVSLVGFGVATGAMLRMLGRRNESPKSADDVCSISEVEQAVKTEIERRSQVIQDWPLDFAADGLPACSGCEHLVKVGRKDRCRDVKCFRQKLALYRQQITGPQKAAELHEKYTGWQKFDVQPFTRCVACDRNASDLPAGAQWYKAGIFAVCPECWQRAGLTEPDPEPLQEDIPSPQEEAGAAPQKLDMALLVTDIPYVAPSAENEEDSEPAEIGSARAVITRPAGPPAVILTARILPGPIVAERRVMLSIAEEGKPPAVLKADTYAMLPLVITEALDAFFGNGNISQEIPSTQEVSNGQETVQV